MKEGERELTSARTSSGERLCGFRQGERVNTEGTRAIARLVTSPSSRANASRGTPDRNARRALLRLVVLSRTRGGQNKTSPKISQSSGWSVLPHLPLLDYGLPPSPSLARLNARKKRTSPVVNLCLIVSNCSLSSHLSGSSLSQFPWSCVGKGRLVEEEGVVAVGPLC